MTPDERADRAERVIVEAIAHFRECAAWFQADGVPMSLAAAEVFTTAANSLARFARVAGISLDDRRD